MLSILRQAILLKQGNAQLVVMECLHLYRIAWCAWRPEDEHYGDALVSWFDHDRLWLARTFVGELRAVELFGKKDPHWINLPLANAVLGKLLKTEQGIQESEHLTSKPMLCQMAARYSEQAQYPKALADAWRHHVGTEPDSSEDIVHTPPRGVRE